MYKNLRIEMLKKEMTMADLSAKTGIKYQTLSDKMRGESQFTLQEAISIKKALESELPIEILFAVQVE